MDLLLFLCYDCVVSFLCVCVRRRRRMAEGGKKGKTDVFPSSSSSSAPKKTADAVPSSSGLKKSADAASSSGGSKKATDVVPSTSGSGVPKGTAVAAPGSTSSGSMAVATGSDKAGPSGELKLKTRCPYVNRVGKRCEREFQYRQGCKDHMLMYHLIVYDDSCDRGYRLLAVDDPDTRALYDQCCERHSMLTTGPWPPRHYESPLLEVEVNVVRSDSLDRSAVALKSGSSRDSSVSSAAKSQSAGQKSDSSSRSRSRWRKSRKGKGIGKGKSTLSKPTESS